jgi:hypothetical protein
MTEPIYYVMARAKAGEIDAIGRLAPTTHSLVRPTFDFPRQKANDSRTLAHYLNEKVREITASWGTASEVCLDFSRYEPDTRLPDGRHIAEGVFDTARQLHLKAMPVLAPIFNERSGN